MQHRSLQVQAQLSRALLPPPPPHLECLLLELARPLPPLPARPEVTPQLQPSQLVRQLELPPLRLAAALLVQVRMQVPP